MATPWRLLALLPFMALAACTTLGLFNAVIPQDPGVALVAQGVPYGADPRQTLDVYAPDDGARSSKVVVFLYGGAWNSGRRQDDAFAARAFAAKGFVTVVPDTRLVPAVRYPAFVEDTAKAIAWAHRHARDYGGDPSRLYVVGHSAGAYNGVMVALAPEFLRAEGLPTTVIRAVAGLSGPYDFLPLDQPLSQDAFKGVGDLARTQPVNRARAARPTPPMLLAHGEADDFVLPRNSIALASALQRAGHEADLTLYPGVGHRGTLLALALPFRSRTPVLDDVVRFFARH